jgi:ABC-type transport system involved in multi-copper enzyme maturation permease subunit
LGSTGDGKKLGNWSTRFWAIVRYELLWNIRKKKFAGMVVVALALGIIPLALAPTLDNLIGQPFEKNPDYVVGSGGIGGIVLFLFALVTVMNSVSGEFESGTIIPLLTKPVSRTTVFLGKLSAAVITLLPVYVFLFAIEVVGGTVVYGPQNNLYLSPLFLLGSIISTLVWLAIVLAIGSVSKSSLLAALGSFLTYVALSISSGILSVFSGEAWVLTYLPGSGAVGYIQGTVPATPLAPGISVSTGTDSIAGTLVSYILHPSSTVAFVKIGEAATQSPSALTFTVLYTEPLLNVLLTAVGVALTYIVLFSLISWYSIKRAQVTE